MPDPTALPGWPAAMCDELAASYVGLISGPPGWHEGFGAGLRCWCGPVVGWRDLGEVIGGPDNPRVIVHQHGRLMVVSRIESAIGKLLYAIGSGARQGLAQTRDVPTPSDRNRDRLTRVAEDLALQDHREATDLCLQLGRRHAFRIGRGLWRCFERQPCGAAD